MKKLFWRVFNIKWCLFCHKMTRHSFFKEKMFAAQPCSHCGCTKNHKKVLEKMKADCDKKIADINDFLTNQMD